MKRYVRDSNPRTLSGRQFSRLLPRPTGHIPRKTPSRRVFHSRNQSGYSSMEMESNHPNPKATVLQTVPLPLTVYPSKNKVVMFFDIQNSQTFSLLVKLDLGISSKECTGFHVLHIRRSVPLFTDLIGHDPITPRLTDECSAS